RALTSILFLCIAIALASLLVVSSDAKFESGNPLEAHLTPDHLIHRFLEYACWTLAWFWLLSPTQNPWYWTWVLPFVPFVRNRLWLGVGGLAMVYYLRFYFRYELDGVDVLSTGYIGSDYFDFVVVAIEFGPWLALLLATALYRRISGRS
ncbi:MAG: hypothetical protein AAGG44_13430, partial [Planctomycetota bacterium]